MSAPKQPPMKDFLLAAGYGGAERDRSSVPLVRGRDDPALIIAAQSGLPGFTARAVVDAPPTAELQSSWPAKTAAPARVERIEGPAERSRFGQVVAWGNDGTPS